MLVEVLDCVTTVFEVISLRWRGIHVQVGHFPQYVGL